MSFLNLEAKIKEARLTKAESLVAEYLIGNINSVCFMTAMDIAKAVQVSDSSVIRLCRTLGYEGFLHLQKDIQHQMMQQIEESNETFLSPIEILSQGLPKIRESDVIAALWENSITNIKSIIEKNPPEKFEAIAALLVNSRNKYISGFRGCRGIADWLALLLGHMLPNVRLSALGGSEAVESLLDITEEDCVVLLSFHRYSQIALDVGAFTKERGAKLVVFTDKLTAPVVSKADYAVTMRAHGLSFFNSYVPSSFAVELLLTFVSKAIGTQHRDRLAIVDEYVSKRGFF